MTVHVLIKMTSFKQNVEDYTINTNTIVTALITLIKIYINTKNLNPTLMIQYVNTKQQCVDCDEDETDP